MAALAASAVSLYPTDIMAAERFPDKGQRGVITRSLKLVLTGEGGLTNTIGSSALGFTKVLACSNLWDKTNGKGYPAVIDPVLDIVVLLDGAAAPAPVDVTSSETYITVTGTPKIASA